MVAAQPQIAPYITTMPPFGDRSVWWCTLCSVASVRCPRTSIQQPSTPAAGRADELKEGGQQRADDDANHPHLATKELHAV